MAALMTVVRPVKGGSPAKSVAAGNSISGGRKSTVLAVAKQLAKMWRSKKLLLPVTGILVRKRPMEVVRL